jgi:uncharacterized protein YigA (DUF484 family)
MDSYPVTVPCRGSHLSSLPDPGSSPAAGTQPHQPAHEGSFEPAAPHDPCRESFAADTDDSDKNFESDDEYAQILRSFEMIFRLHQRSEAIRAHLACIDGILLRARSVASLVQRVTTALERDLDLVSARILLRDDHPAVALLREEDIRGWGTVSDELLEHGDLFGSDPFFLDDPSGDLGRRLFADSAPSITSAAAANLRADKEEFGLLCLGSDDPGRYCCGSNTDLITALADKVALAIRNAWDHESAVRKALMDGLEGLYGEPFFREYHQKEFDRAWRHETTYSLLAVSWVFPADAEPRSFSEVAQVMLDTLRRSDTAARSSYGRLLFLLPQTATQEAENFSARLIRLCEERFQSSISLHVGITEFSRSAHLASIVLRQAEEALEEACRHEDHRIVVKSIPSPEPTGPSLDEYPSS